MSNSIQTLNNLQPRLESRPEEVAATQIESLPAVLELVDGNKKPPALQRIQSKHGQKVSVHYTYRVIKQNEPGEKIDSSVDRDQPFSFKLGMGEVSKAFDKAVLGMVIGEKTITKDTLGKNTVFPEKEVVLEIELLDIQ